MRDVMPGENPKYVLLNETGFASHHGCRSVSKVLRREMRARGFELQAARRSEAGMWDDAAFRSALAASDLLLINGEGTLHHGAPGGVEIMKAFAEPACRHLRIALVNAIWQDNPPEWAAMLDGADIVALRDRGSVQELADLGVKGRFVPDLSFMSHPARHPSTQHAAIGWGDSVNKSLARTLGARAAARGEVFLPIQSSVRHLPDSPVTALKRTYDGLTYGIRTRAKLARANTAQVFETPEQYFQAISSLGLFITGRFHGVCLAILAGVPFVAFRSNSRKVEQLVLDAGLNPARVMSLDDLPHEIVASDWRYDEQEWSNRKEFLDLACKTGADLFDDIQSLV